MAVLCVPPKHNKCAKRKRCYASICRAVLVLSHGSKNAMAIRSYKLEYRTLHKLDAINNGLKCDRNEMLM